MADFSAFDFSDEQLEVLAELSYTQPTPIQQKAIPAIQTGRDVLAAAQTGTGKTAAFVLPLLQRIETLDDTGLPSVIILAPTRELADQIANSAKRYASDEGIRTVALYGGIDIAEQVPLIEAGFDILVATPGRFIDLMKRGYLDLSIVQHVVLDEADRMLAMGFIDDIKQVFKWLPNQHQRLLFSATFSEGIIKLADELLEDPVRIEIEATNSAVETIRQLVFKVDKKDKKDILHYLIEGGKWQKTLVFTRTKRGADEVFEYLNKEGIPSIALHSNKSQHFRGKALEKFKRGEIRVLVATDVASRGLDIEQLPQIVNFDIPNHSEDYVHRIGRTGRAGNKGLAVSLACDIEVPFMRGIEALIGRALPPQILPFFEPGQKKNPLDSMESRGEHSDYDVKTKKDKNKPQQKKPSTVSLLNTKPRKGTGKPTLRERNKAAAASGKAQTAGKNKGPATKKSSNNVPSLRVRKKK